MDSTRRDGSAGHAAARAAALVAVATLCALAAIAGAGSGAAPTSHTNEAGGAPNFVLVLVDDQARNSFRRRFMPRTFRSLLHSGSVFTNALAAPPLCCPDRAGIITGQYPHNHGVFSNHPGYPELKDPQDTLPVWLEQAGYRTAFFGKFLNHYGDTAGTAPAPGFDRWFAMQDDPTVSYYRYEVSDDGTVRRYGHRRRDYSTDVLTRKATQFVGERHGASSPFFLWLSYNAPHVARAGGGPCRGLNPQPPGRAAYRRFKDVPLPRPPSFNERDVSDKPEPIRSLSRLRRHSIEKIRRGWRCTLATLGEVDKGVDRLMGELRRDGELRRTIVLYLSDNGYFFGQHRLELGKGFAYEPALRVPFAARVPAAYRKRAPAPRVRKLVSNQDIAPTLLGYVSRYSGSADPCARPGDCRRMDGHRLQPLLGGRGEWPSKRGVLAEVDARRSPSRARRIDPECNCAYEAIRTGGYLYSELSNGERELYDLRRDPHELRNRDGWTAYAATEQRLAARLERLRGCSGVEGRDPPLPSPFCE